MTRRPMTPTQQQAAQLWAQGVPCNEIASTLGVTRWNVIYWRRAYGWLARRAYAQRPIRHPRKPRRALSAL